MKRICTWICVLTVLLSSFSGAVFAAENQDAEESSLTGEEIAFLQRELSGYGYGEENFTADVLYDGQGNPAYMLGVTDGGYLIHERGTYGFEERGEGNPFSDYMDVQKYYGGPICYFVYSPDPENPENCYYDILRDEYSNFVPKLNTKSDMFYQMLLRFIRAWIRLCDWTSGC